MESELNEEIHVHCPNCTNKRLFDCGTTAEGIVRIKCPYCRAVAAINLRHVTEQQRRKRLVTYQRFTTNYRS